LSGEKVKALSLTALEALAPVKEKITESEKQLLDYQTRLVSKYGEVLRLQLISVVAVGFERVVWQTVL
jgi:ABC-type tungstate transport system substrate-binding protein